MPKQAEKRPRTRPSPFAGWKPTFQWPKRVVPGFQPSFPTYAALHDPAKAYGPEDFQAVGSSWLIENRTGILGDDMGLGKCKQTLDATMHVGRHEVPQEVVILCEASNIDTWMDELKRWYPEQLRFAYRGTKRREQYTKWQLDTYLHPTLNSYVVMSYAVFRTDVDFIKNWNTTWAILDEGHVIRGSWLNGEKSQSQLGRRIHELKAYRRHILSGTPVISTLADWWNIGRWLHVEEREWKQFAKETLVIISIQVSRYVRQNKIVGIVPGADNVIKAMIERCMLRRETEDVLSNFPTLRKITRKVRMESREVAKYNDMKKQHEDAVKKLAAGDEPAINPQVALMRMEQLTSSIQSKVDYAMTLMEEATGAGQKVLIFTKHLETLRMLYRALEKKKQTFVYIHGGVSTDANAGEQSERGIAVHRFQNDADCKVLIGTAQACRVGLTLTAATLVILMDEEFTPTYVRQLMKRAHRIGQTKPVLVIRLEAVIPAGSKIKRTIERQIQRRLENKADILSGVVTTSSFSDKEMVALLKDDEFEDEDEPEID
jgi:ATP-dependent DNA helicase